LLQADQLAELEVQVVRVESLPDVRPNLVRSRRFDGKWTRPASHRGDPSRGDASAPGHLQSPFM